MKRYVAVIALVLGLLLASVAQAAKEKKVEARQEGNRLVFRYELEADGSETESDVTLTLTIDGRTYTQKDLHLEGDIGKVPVGKGKILYWNILQDFPRGLSTGIWTGSFLPSTALGGDGVCEGRVFRDGLLELDERLRE
jgi:hypothetical protein